MTTEQWLQRLEDESESLKQSFLWAANSIPVHTVSDEFTTSRNAITTHSPFGNTTFSENERFAVTFDSDDGIDVLAVLELSSDNGAMLTQRRQIHPGGARWIISAPAQGPIEGPWVATNYQIVVHASAPGSLSFEELESNA